MSKEVSPAQLRQLAAASKLYKGFTGRRARILGRVDVPPVPKTGVAIGPVLGIIYQAPDGGRNVKYLHRFEKSCQPLLVASPDGSSLWLLGGRYHFTARGIVDAPRKKRGHQR